MNQPSLEFIAMVWVAWQIGKWLLAGPQTFTVHLIHHFKEEDNEVESGD